MFGGKKLRKTANAAKISYLLCVCATGKVQALNNVGDSTSFIRADKAERWHGGWFGAVVQDAIKPRPTLGARCLPPPPFFPQNPLGPFFIILPTPNALLSSSLL